MDLHDWVLSNISAKTEWNSRFALSVWIIWKQRNKFIFKSKNRSLLSIKMMVDRYMEGVRETGLIDSSCNRLEQNECRWLLLAEYWCNWKLGRLIKIGMEHARSCNVQNMILEADSLVVINMIKNGVEKDHPLFLIIADIRELAVKADWNITFSHILREGNRVANVLANIAHRCPNGIQDDVRGTWLPRGFSR
ncbi:reverse transcriptase [Senna tora]|uniref:Reverse transcriptase n=1 Tax=Senna tora TaxID=362788 RepID=A0A834WQM5_9FABA|nr:reverse transcriptase [Senna tora]